MVSVPPGGGGGPSSLGAMDMGGGGYLQSKCGCVQQHVSAHAIALPLGPACPRPKGRAGALQWMLEGFQGATTTVGVMA